MSMSFSIPKPLHVWRPRSLRRRRRLVLGGICINPHCVHSITEFIQAVSPSLRTTTSVCDNVEKLQGKLHLLTPLLSPFLAYLQIVLASGEIIIQTPPPTQTSPAPSVVAAAASASSLLSICASSLRKISGRLRRQQRQYALRLVYAFASFTGSPPTILTRPLLMATSGSRP
jgi:hypothetical protein